MKELSPPSSPAASAGVRASSKNLPARGRFRWKRAAVCLAGATAVASVVLAQFTTRLSLNSPAQAAVTPGPLFAEGKAFITENCVTCHNGTEKAGRLDLSALPYDP